MLANGICFHGASPSLMQRESQLVLLERDAAVPASPHPEYSIGNSLSSAFTRDVGHSPSEALVLSLPNAATL